MVTVTMNIPMNLSQTANFGLKEFADDNFRFNDIGKEFFRLVQNTVGKGEIAHYKQFLLSPQCFQKTSTANM